MLASNLKSEEDIQLNQYTISFWRNISTALGTKHEAFPLSLFYAALDISSEEVSEVASIFPSEVIINRKKINRYSALILLIF